MSEHSDIDDLRAQLAAAETENEAGRLEAAEHLLRQVLDASKPSGDGSRADALAVHLEAGLRLGEIVAALGREGEVTDIYHSVRSLAHAHGEVVVELWATLTLLEHYVSTDELDTAASYVPALRPLLVAAYDDGDDDAGASPGWIHVPELAQVHELLLELCHRIYYAENYDAAEMIARLILERDREFLPALTYLGYVQLRRGDDGAVDTWRLAAEAAPEVAFVHTNLAAAYVNADKLVEAVVAVSKSIELVPDNPLTLRARANYHQALGHDELALADLETIILLADAAGPDPGQSLTSPTSQAEYDRTMSLRDQADLASLSRVMLLREMGRTGDAMDAARHLVETGDKPTAAAGARLLADMQREDGDRDGAVRTITQAIDAETSGLEDLLLARARLHVESERYAEAIADLDAASDSEEHARQAIAILVELAGKDPAPAGVDRALGHAYLTAWLPSKAHAHLMAAAEHGPLDAMALYWRALSVITYVDQEDTEERRWGDSLTLGRIWSVVEDLAAAHSLAPTDEIARTLRWVVERAVQYFDIFHRLAFAAEPGSPIHAWPGFELLRELWEGADLGSSRRWAEAVAALAAVREKLVAAGFPLMAGLAAVLAADSSLRLYELQRADDLLTAGEAAMSHFSTPLATNLQEQSSRQIEAGEQSGIPILAMDYDHLSFVLATRDAMQRTIDPLRAQLAARTGDRVQVAALLERMEPVDELVAKLRDGQVETALLTAYATMLRDLGRFDEALKLADAVGAEPADEEDRLKGLNIAATVLMRTGDLDAAAERLEQAIELAGRVAPHAVFTVASNLTSVEAMRGNHAAALAMMDAHPLPDGLPYPQVFGRRAQRGISLQRLDRYDEALTELLAAVDLHESVRANLRSVDDRIAWQSQADRVSLYEEAILAAICADQPTTAFELVERSKARSFVDQLASGPLPTDESSQRRQEVLDRVRSRLQLLDELTVGVDGFVDHEAVKRLIQLGGEDPRITQPDRSVVIDPQALARGKELTQAAAERIQAEIDEIRAALVEGVAGEVASVASLSELLRRESEGGEGQIVLVEYYVAAVWSAVFVLKGDGDLQVELMQGNRDDLVYVAQNTFSGLDDALATDLDGWADSVEALVRPIVRHTDPGDLVWLVPYGPLHYLPLHAAVVDEVWLVERNPVVYSPSASVLPYCMGRRSQGTDAALVLGDSRGDLVHARHEAELVAARLGTEALVTSAARKATVLDRIREQGAFGVVHFACHGFFDSEEAFRSGLLMSAAGGRNEDGVLTAKDLNDTRLDADLVALSACRSGVSAQHSGDELIGLTRAILHSGASSVMVSLWTVDDYSTALLMDCFYDELLSAPDLSSAWAKPLALRSAQLALMDMTAAQVAEGLRERIGSSPPDLAAVLELDLADVHAMAGDVDGALQHCQLAIAQAADSSLALRATAYADKLRFERAVRERQHEIPPVDWTLPVFAHPAHWAAFIMVGDWQSSTLRRA